MDFLIVTGLSGAGKSRAVEALEDIGFFCVDNMPPKLISRFAEIALQSGGKMTKVAVVSDVRGGTLFNDFQSELDLMQQLKIDYKLLFLDCSDEILLRRFKETRRRHPLIDQSDASLERAIEAERALLVPFRARADYIIDTSNMALAQFRERINTLFLENPSASMQINCMSFGFKYGAPAEADLMFDVRCLPNPFYIDSLKYKTGLDADVNEYVMAWPQSVLLLQKLVDLLDYLIPLYMKEGKSQLTVAFGCTGGKHRSVTFAEKLYAHFSEQNLSVSVNHRDISKT